MSDTVRSYHTDKPEGYLTMADLARVTGIARFTLDRYVAGVQPKNEGEADVVPIPFEIGSGGRKLFHESLVPVIMDIYRRSEIGKSRVSDDRVPRTPKSRPRPVMANVHLRRPTTVMVEMGIEDIDAILEHLPTTSVLYQRVCAINDSTEWNRW